MAQSAAVPTEYAASRSLEGECAIGSPYMPAQVGQMSWSRGLRTRAREHKVRNEQRSRLYIERSIVASSVPFSARRLRS